MGRKRDIDRAIGRIAGRQHRVITTAQFAESGLPDSAVSKRVKAAHLFRIHRGVYAVGSLSLSREGRWLAAVLACGEGAVLSHRSAAELWELLRPRGGPVHVTVPGTAGRQQRRRIRTHRSLVLDRRECASRRGVPVTTPARTIADLRRTVGGAEVRRAVRQAEVLGLPLGAAVESDGTRSELERRFLAICRRHGLPTPEVDARLGDLRVDFLWRRERLVVETDGYRYHRGREAFEVDRERDARLNLLGFRPLRFTQRQLVNDAATVVATLKRYV